MNIHRAIVFLIILLETSPLQSFSFNELNGEGYVSKKSLGTNTTLIEGSSMEQVRASYQRAHGSILQGLGYVPNEVIVKYKESTALKVKEDLLKGKKVDEIQLSNSLDELHRRCRVRDIRSVFPNFKEKRRQLESLKYKDKIKLSKRDKHLLKRLKRAPTGVEVPELDRIYKLKVELAKGESFADMLEEYRRNPDVEYAELNYIVAINATPNDLYYPLQWPLDNTGQIYPASGNYNPPPGTPDYDIDAPEAWDMSTGDSEVIVAVLDTGVDYNHRDLSSNLWTDSNGYHGYNFIEDSNDPMDDHGHGTHCAGIIAAQGNNGLDITGICWNARIMALKFLNSDGTGNTIDAIEAIEYAVDNAADVISNSWGAYDYSQALQDVIDYANSQGVIVVAAAGNENTDIPQYPASLNHVIAVAATNSNDEKPYFSNYGNWVHIAAPGVDILSLRANGTSMGTTYDDYTTIASGTSMACPHVSGACALLLSDNPTLTADHIVDILMDTADPISKGVSVSDGRLNLFGTIRTTQGHISFNSDYYSCSTDIEVRLFDNHIAGQGAQEITTTTISGDQEVITLTEAEPTLGFFTGTISTDSGPVNIDDGTLQLSHNEIITATYLDSNDGTGNPINLTDTAIIDCNGPVVYDIQVDVRGSRPTVTFQTDELATARVLCGTICGSVYTIEANSVSPATDHTITLNGVVPETDYFFILEATDALYNTAVHDNNEACYSFTTSEDIGDIYVPADFPTIQEAIDNAWDNDIIWVADGIYVGVGNYDIDFKGLAITVQSENGPNNCIIDCQKQGRGFFFHSNESTDSVLDGFTIKNGYPPSNVSPSVDFDAWLGGGIYCNNSSPTITNCKIIDNIAPYWGGGLCARNADITVKDCIFSRNRGDVRGGGIYSDGARLTLENCTVSMNSSSAEGAGICFYGEDLLINKCVITDNYLDTFLSLGLGGGVACFNSGVGNISGSIIRGNSANFGGGIYVNSSGDMTIANCVISDNLANSKGGGIRCLGSGQYAFTNCTVSDNKASEAGGMMATSVETLVSNCIFWNNTTVSGPELKLTASVNMSNVMTIWHSNIQGGQSEISVDEYSTLNWGNGNIDSEPIFALEEDYHLMGESPCIDTGSNHPNGGLPETDIDENIRSLDGDGDGIAVADIGAYEFNSNTSSIAVSPSIFQFTHEESVSTAEHQVLSIRNCGGGTLSWQINESCSWLQVDPDNGISTGEINTVFLAVDSNQLTAGNYDCELEILDSKAVNSPVAISVRLHVTGRLMVPTQYPTIQSAIDAAQDGDVVLVADGIYTGTGNRDINFRGKAIIVKSENGPDNCVIDCEGTDAAPHRAFTFYNSGEDANSIIDGFTITGGYVNFDFLYIFPPAFGGGIYCSAGYPAVRNCIIKDNWVLFDGGGLYIWWKQGATRSYITNCIIMDNYANEGGGIWTDNDVTLTDSIIANNASFDNGGGIHINYISQQIRNCTIANNSAINSGGGMFVGGGWYSDKLEVSNCVFWDNVALQGSEISLNNNLTPSDSPPVELILSHSIIYGGIDNIYLGNDAILNWRTGNIDSDPLFIESTLADYHLPPDSPAIDAGQEIATGMLEGVDIDGNIRPIDGDYDGLAISDIGAYEFMPLPFGYPIIAISNRQIDFEAFQGGPNPEEQILKIHNGGAGIINWTITNDCDWLDLGPISGSSAGEVDEVILSADISGLTRGRYDCELAVIDTNASNNPRTFSATLRVFIEGQLYVPSEYGTIQQAINKASDGETIIVSPGVYEENINFGGKNITLISIDPNDAGVVAETIIQGDGTDSVVTFAGNEDSCRIIGFTITGGNARNDGGGIRGRQTRATISKCIIRENHSDNSGGGIHGCSGIITDCVIKNNSADSDGAGLSDCHGNIINSLITGNISALGAGLNNCNANITNCTIVSNEADKGAGLASCDGEIINCIIWGNSIDQLYRSSNLSFSCIQGSHGGSGNIDVYPEFVDLEGGNYHLRPGSFCIDAGTDETVVELEKTDLEGRARLIDGDNDGNSAVDMGCYESLSSNKPVIGLSTWKLVLTNQDTEDKILNIRNSGGETCNWSISWDCNWLQITPTQGSSMGKTTEVKITVDKTKVSWGSYDCTLIISDSNAVNSSRLVDVTLYVVGELIYITSETSTIQNAINSVLDGGEVIVADGIYQGPGNRDIDFLGKSITVRSENGPEKCIIDVNGTPQEPHRGFHFRDNEDANSVLEGFTILNGYTNNGGSGVLCESSGPTIKDCIFTGNSAGADDNGGAISNISSDSTLLNCTFNDNSAKRGAGVYNEFSTSRLTNCTFNNNSAENGGGIYNKSSNIVLIECEFNNNLATLELWINGGGGVYNYQSSPTLINCTFTENRAAWDGGAIFNIYGSNPNIRNCFFRNNHAMGNDGGGLFNIFNSNPSLVNCAFIANFAKSWGGAMRNRQSSPQLTNCILLGNFARDNGGAIFNFSNSNLRLINCTLSANYANGNAGDGIYNMDGSNPTLTNCILWNNGSEIANDQSSASVTYSDVQGGQTGQCNINIDPCFVKPGYWDSNDLWIDGDYSLLKNSLCINTGDPNYIPEPNNGMDINGNPRVIGNRIDIGAYEFDPLDLLIDLSESIDLLDLQAGIANSLEAKLDVALRLLQDTNENNNISAFNSLQAFINAVQAQRGKKISEEDADDLIAAAQQIIDLLNSD